MTRRLALDIGATTVTARHRNAHGGRSTVLFDGSPSVPAAVCFEGKGACAGRAAVAAGAGDPTSFAGSPLTAVLDGRLRYGGVDRDPAELIMPVLSLVLGHAQDIDPEPPEQIACVVPLGASGRLRKPMTMAATSLGLPEPFLIPEPVAAVLHATGGQGLPPGSTGVVIDAGGSSMEVTVLRGTESGAPEIVADRSDRSLGGDDVDARIMAWLGAALERENPGLASALRAETNRTLLAALHQEVRRAKEELSRFPETDIAVTTLTGHGTVRITRGDLTRILADWSARARALASATLTAAGLPADGSIGCFIIGGGASLPTLPAALAPVGRLTLAHEPLTAAADGALLADDAVLAEIAAMDEVPRRPVAKPEATPVEPRDTPPPAHPMTQEAPQAPGMTAPPAAPVFRGAAVDRPRPASPFAGAVGHRPPVRGTGAASPYGAIEMPARFSKIWPGTTHIAAEAADGTMWQWGDLPRLYFGGKPRAPQPVHGVVGPVQSGASGASFTVIVDARGRMIAWGSCDMNQIGVERSPIPKDAPVRPIIPAPVTAVSCGTSHSLAVTEDGHVLAWGAPMGGRLGYMDALDLAPQVPQPVTHTVCDIVGVAAGRNHSLALDENGDLWGWGNDNRGQISGTPGLGSLHPMRLPTAVAFTGIVAGKDITLALDADGGVWSWGRNDRGQLGLGGPATRSGAGRVGLPGPAVRIFAGHGHAGAVLADGALFVWGSNNHGQLGFPGANRSFTSVPRPVVMPGGARVADAGGGDGYTACLTVDGAVFTWGNGFHGVDGGGSRGRDNPTPTRPAGSRAG
ncbi:Hsp70 family protein [Corynebacterium hansenii]|uniref:Hsp70 family protein n=1 Tax=Corynebacterium hansenii TaxID=394964 RepID=A0ABV7ZRJ4_9CORY|nr:Hsp70 family protein [Corynebacterium hansenii]WJZ00013.1 Chaperone protein DnaK [Corynebacterium hansenii]